jgi:hypothetical protein
MTTRCEFSDCPFPFEQHSEACIRADEHERLRAKAMNLPSRVVLDLIGDEVTWVRYADVLALLKEKSDG